jgi:hypothetical protein
MVECRGQAGEVGGRACQHQALAAKCASVTESYNLKLEERTKGLADVKNDLHNDVLALELHEKRSADQEPTQATGLVLDEEGRAALQAGRGSKVFRVWLRHLRRHRL